MNKKLSESDIQLQKRIVLTRVDELERVAYEYPEKIIVSTPYIALCPAKSCTDCFLYNSNDCFCNKNGFFFDILNKISKCMYKEGMRLMLMGLIQILREQLEEVYDEHDKE